MYTTPIFRNNMFNHLSTLWGEAKLYSFRSQTTFLSIFNRNKAYYLVAMATKTSQNSFHPLVTTFQLYVNNLEVILNIGTYFLLFCQMIYFILDLL